MSTFTSLLLTLPAQPHIHLTLLEWFALSLTVKQTVAEVASEAHLPDKL
jgi:hypothetical protein